MPVPDLAVGLEVARSPSRSASSRSACARPPTLPTSSRRSRPAVDLAGHGSSAEQHARGIAAGIGHQPRPRDLVPVQLGQAVHGLGHQIGPRMIEAVPRAVCLPDPSAGSRRSDRPPGCPRRSARPRRRELPRADSKRRPRRTRPTDSGVNSTYWPSTRRCGKTSHTRRPTYDFEVSPRSTTSGCSARMSVSRAPV